MKSIEEERKCPICGKTFFCLKESDKTVLCVLAKEDII
jgi:hypothetical protein